MPFNFSLRPPSSSSSPEEEKPTSSPPLCYPRRGNETDALSAPRNSNSAGSCSGGYDERSLPHASVYLTATPTASGASSRTQEKSVSSRTRRGSFVRCTSTRTVSSAASARFESSLQLSELDSACSRNSTSRLRSERCGTTGVSLLPTSRCRRAPVTQVVRHALNPRCGKSYCGGGPSDFGSSSCAPPSGRSTSRPSWSSSQIWSNDVWCSVRCWGSYANKDTQLRQPRKWRNTRTSLIPTTLPPCPPWSRLTSQRRKQTPCPPPGGESLLPSLSRPPPRRPTHRALKVALRAHDSRGVGRSRTCCFRAQKRALLLPTRLPRSLGPLRSKSSRPLIHQPRSPLSVTKMSERSSTRFTLDCSGQTARCEQLS
mmetsp:Transcript_14945/g.35254  ORF Transcript_14945/g.35254 Transcript_14945/m.35254 type:complete len:371 (-) Transcript_14945:375-1487(-)